MERTKAEVIRTPFLQLHERPDNLDDVDPAEYLLYGVWRNHVGQWWMVNSESSIVTGMAITNHKSVVSGQLSIVN